MKAKEIDKKFDEGENITKYLDISKARRPGQELRRGCGVRLGIVAFDIRFMI